MINLTCDQCLLPIDLHVDRWSVQPPTSNNLDFHNQECMSGFLASHDLDPEPEPEAPTDDESSDVPIPDEDGTIYRDAVTGRFVTPAYAAAHPDTTVSEAPPAP